MAKLKVFRWQGFRSEVPGNRKQTQEIVAATSKAAAARAAGVAYPTQLFNLGETGNAADIAQAMSAPGTVFYRSLDDRSEPWMIAPSKEPAPARRRAPVSSVTPEAAAKLPVFCWDAVRPEAPGRHHQTREIVAVPTRAAAARAAGVPDPRKLHNLYETPQPDEIALARSEPGVVFWQPIHAPVRVYARAGENPPEDFFAAPASDAPPATPVTVPTLAGCPCCGGAAEFAVGEHSFTDVKVVCSNCGLESGLADDDTDVEVNKAQAAAEWNRRALTPATRAAMSAAVAFIEDEAACFKESSTTADGHWPEPEDKVRYEEMQKLAADLAAVLIGTHQP